MFHLPDASRTVRWALLTFLALAALVVVSTAAQGAVIQNPSGKVRIGIGTDGLIGAQVGATDPGRTLQTSCGGGTSEQQDIRVIFFYNAPGPEHCEFIQSAGYGGKLAISYDSTIGPGETRWENCVARGTGCKPGGAAAQPPIFTPTFSNCAAPSPATLGSTCDLAFTIGPAGAPCLNVTHKYRPSALDNLYEIEVHLEANCPVENVYYRQVHSLKVGSVGYSGDSRSQSLQGVEAFPSMLRFAIDNHNVWGSTTENPISRGGLGGSANDVDCAGGSPPWQGPGRWDEVPFAPFPGAWFTDHSACTQAGAMFDFDLGDFEVGDGRTFYVYYGAGDDEAQALAQLADPAIDADMWGLFQTDNGGAFLPTWTWAYKFVEPTAIIDAIDTPTSPPLFPSLACTGTLVSFDAGSLGIAPVVNAWEFGDGTALAMGDLVTHSYANPGTYTVNLTVEDADGWNDLASADVEVVDCTQPDASFTWSAVGEAPHPCEGEDVTFQDTSVAGSTPIDRSRWTFGGTTVDIDPYATAALPRTMEVPGTVTVTLQIWDENGYTDTATGTVPICQILCPDITGFNDTLFVNQPVDTLILATDPNGPALTVTSGALPAGASFAGASLSGMTSLSASIPLVWIPGEDQVGLHALQFTANDTFCTDTVTIHIDVKALPTPPNPTIDSDGDGVADVVDNCGGRVNRDQIDRDGDTFGDACDASPGTPVATGSPAPLDTDRDGVADVVDNCRITPNPDQADTDHDGKGNACSLTTATPQDSTDVVCVGTQLRNGTCLPALETVLTEHKAAPTPMVRHTEHTRTGPPAAFWAAFGIVLVLGIVGAAAYSLRRPRTEPT